MWQSGHARVRLGVMTKFALLVIVGATVIFSEFFLLLSRVFFLCDTGSNKPFGRLPCAF